MGHSKIVTLGPVFILSDVFLALPFLALSLRFPSLMLKLPTVIEATEAAATKPSHQNGTLLWVKQFAEPGADEQELATPMLSLCHGIFTDWCIFSTLFLLWKKGSSGPVTQWRQLMSCDWLWHSHGSLIQSRFDLKINRSVKTPWQKYSGVACSCS